MYFLPYLMGERSPHNDPDARGAFLGLTMDTTRADMTQAVLEGVAFALRDSLEVARSLGIQAKRTKLCGGGAKSPLWRRILANALGLCVEVAAVACGEYRSVAEAAQRIVRVKDIIEPESGLAALYEERYRQFREIYPVLKPLFPKLQPSNE